MPRKTMIRMGILGGAAVVATAAALTVAHAGGQQAAPAFAPETASGARYSPASELGAADLLNAPVLSAQARGMGRITKVNFDDRGQVEWVWLRFDGVFSDWELRAPVSSLYMDRTAGKLRTDRTLDELRRLAEADPETSARTATAIPARYAPASRLMGLKIVGNRDDQVGYVHSVRADASGAADYLIVERRFGLFHAKTERYTVPADQVSYLPVTQKLKIHEMPQPVLASLSGHAEG